MSPQRLFHWTCDYCSKEVTHGPFGLPEGWIVVEANLRGGHGTLHFCDKYCHLGHFPKDAPDKDDTTQIRVLNGPPMLIRRWESSEYARKHLTQEQVERQILESLKQAN